MYISSRPVETGRSCRTPRGTSVKGGDWVLAYQTSSSTSACLAQRRDCQDGFLAGSYQYANCTLRLAGPAVVVRTGYTVYNPVPTSYFTGAKKYSQELIQPTSQDLSGKLFDTDGKRVTVLPNAVDERRNGRMVSVARTGAYLDTIIPSRAPRWTSTNIQSCRAPR